MRVWIDQDNCTGDGLCEELCPAVFSQEDDGLAYVKEKGVLLNEPGGRDSVAAVPAGMEDAVRDAQDQCAGECIFIEE